jgi:tetratricopeptide (TPR) repeat protein
MTSARIVRLALLVLCAAVGLAGHLQPAHAQESAAPRADTTRKEPGVMMSERAFRRFEAITTAYEEARYADALAAAEAYLQAELNEYERAMGEQITGYILIALDRLDEAVPRFQRAIELDALPNSAHFGMMRSLAQLYATREQWRRSLDMMAEYLRYQPEPTAEDRILVAQNHVQLGQHREALPWVRGAIKDAGADAQENWYQLELAIHFELGDHRAALPVLKAMVARWPDRLRYWEYLAGAHQELGQDADALAALMAAYNGGLVEEEAKLLNLVRMNLYLDSPYQGGVILARALEAGQVEARAANLQLLLQAWTAAREFERAARVIDRLAPLTGDGELFLQQARLMMEQNEWQATLEAARKALELGNLSQPGNAWLLVGIALMELEQLQESRRAFQQAQEFGVDARRQAREWQRFVEDRIEAAELRSRS